jgi:hypothetical protein
MAEASQFQDPMSSFASQMRSVRKARLKSRQYALNADIIENEADEAYRIGEVNSQVENVERVVQKGETKAAFSGTGFVSTTGSSADVLQLIDSEYGKTMAAIQLDAAGQQNALMFESRKSDIQAEYMKKISKITKRNAQWGLAIDTALIIFGGPAGAAAASERGKQAEETAEGSNEREVSRTRNASIGRRTR